MPPKRIASALSVVVAVALGLASGAGARAQAAAAPPQLPYWAPDAAPGAGGAPLRYYFGDNVSQGADGAASSSH